MIVKDQIEKLKELKVYSGLLRSGIIPVNVNSQYEMNSHYNIRLHVNIDQFEDPKVRSKEESAQAFNCCPMTIHRANVFMNTEVKE